MILNVWNTTTMEIVKSVSMDVLSLKESASLRTNSVRHTAKMEDVINVKRDIIHQMKEFVFQSSLDAFIKKESANIVKIPSSMMRLIKFAELVDACNFFLMDVKDAEILSNLPNIENARFPTV